MKVPCTHVIPHIEGSKHQSPKMFVVVCSVQVNKASPLTML